MSAVWFRPLHLNGEQVAADICEYYDNGLVDLQYSVPGATAIAYAFAYNVVHGHDLGQWNIIGDNEHDSGFKAI